MGKLGVLRTFAMNGGSIRKQPDHEQETHAEFPDRFLKVPDHLNWEIFDRVSEPMNYDSGTQHLLR